MANMMTERATAADWESKLMDTLESYNKHPAFVRCSASSHTTLHGAMLTLLPEVAKGDLLDIWWFELLPAREGLLDGILSTEHNTCGIPLHGHL